MPTRASTGHNPPRARDQKYRRSNVTVPVAASTFNGRSPLADDYVELITSASAGCPYFIQFICREVYDAALGQLAVRSPQHSILVPMEGIIRKLDADFFAGRWARATDRQRELLWVIAALDNCDDEFTVQEVVEASKKLLPKPFGASHVNHMLSTLGNRGLVYKDRHGKYSFAVPLFGQFISRQNKEATGIT